MSIPVPVPGSPWNDVADSNTGLVVNTSIPVPAADAPYGGTVNEPVYFYNRTLGTDGIVCGTSNWTAGRSCCPRAIGILDTASLTNCRFRDTSGSRAYWDACTKAVGGGAYPIESRCWPVQDFLDYTQHHTAAELRRINSIEPIACGAIGPTAQWNYTATCCEQARGRSSQWRAVRGAEDQWSATDCLMADANQQSVFNSCISQYTWAVCNNTGVSDSRHGSGSSSAGSVSSVSTSTPRPSSMQSTTPSEAWVTRPRYFLLLVFAALAGRATAV